MPIYEYYCQDCEKKFNIKATIQEKGKGLKVNCPECGSGKAIQLLGNFFTFPKGKGSNSGGCCGTNSTPGCCG
ncbi:MAG: zinc ribbon domain-containing protein [Candidatus Omnitrophota bacterium]|nr:MAG: zinc ribbon domain-containing protein [Candidatus Omnitrophota bacterium]